MLTDELPASWHSDEYLREWARQRGMVYPVTRIPLISVGPTNEAVIYFDKPGYPVERRAALPQSAEHSNAGS